MKTCSTCKIEKPYTEFHRDSHTSDGYRFACKSCRSAWHKKNYDPANNRRKHLKTTYGVSVEEFEEQLRRQNGKCPICLVVLRVAVEDSYASDTAVIDHDHDHDFLRGILCSKCNKSLGLAGDNEEGLARFQHYLDNPTWQITGQLELDLGL